MAAGASHGCQRTHHNLHLWNQGKVNAVTWSWDLRYKDLTLYWALIFSAGSCWLVHSLHVCWLLYGQSGRHLCGAACLVS